MFKSKDTVSVGKHTVQVVSKIGEGGHATIYLVKDTTTGEKMVLKKSTPAIQAQMDMAQREVALNRQLSHENIVKFRGDSITEYRKNGKKMYDVHILMEYCPGGHLLDRVNKQRKSGRPLSEQEILKYYVQVCRAVDYLHRHKPPVAHRDLKLENILIQHGGVVKLCDFGSCSTDVVTCKTKEDRIKQDEIIDKYTTPFYRPPEMCDLFRGDEISHKVDVWALGCMLYAMAFGKHAFEDGGKLGVLNGRYQIPANAGYSDDFLAVIKWTLNPDPARRPEIGDVLDYVEELIGAQVSQTAKRRGSGSGERPSTELLASLGIGAGIAALDLTSKPRSRRSTRSSSRSSQGDPNSVPTAPTRNRTPSAALRARLARRTGSQSSSGSLPSPGAIAPPPSSPGSVFNPFDFQEQAAAPASSSSENLLTLDVFNQASYASAAEPPHAPMALPGETSSTPHPVQNPGGSRATPPTGTPLAQSVNTMTPTQPATSAPNGFSFAPTNTQNAPAVQAPASMHAGSTALGVNSQLVGGQQGFAVNQAFSFPQATDANGFPQSANTNAGALPLQPGHPSLAPHSQRSASFETRSRTSSAASNPFEDLVPNELSATKKDETMNTTIPQGTSHFQNQVDFLS